MNKIWSKKQKLTEDEYHTVVHPFTRKSSICFNGIVFSFTYLQRSILTLEVLCVVLVYLRPCSCELGVYF